LGYWDGDKYKEIFKNGDKDRDILKEFLIFLRDEAKTKTIIYAHNGGKFDTYLLLKVILTSNIFEITKFLNSNGRILSLTIKEKKGGKKAKEFIFRDSLNFIACSLDKACKDFQPEHKKLEGDVDHNKININNCHTVEIYNYVRRYLEFDCYSLYEILQKFDKEIKKAYGFGIREIMTNASIARRVFLGKFYDQDKTPIYTHDADTDRELRKYYFGGRNEVMTRLGYHEGKFFYVDFTSLYPYVMNKYYFPVGKCKRFKVETTKCKKDWFGFIRVEMRHTHRNQLPFHPVVVRNKLVFPHIENWTESIITTEDYWYSVQNNLGYEYKIKEVFNYDKKAKIFKKPTDELYKMKLEAQEGGNEALRSIAKIIINSLYGFWGINYLNRRQTEVRKEKYSRKKTSEDLLFEKENLVCKHGKKHRLEPPKKKRGKDCIQYWTYKECFQCKDEIEEKKNAYLETTNYKGRKEEAIEELRNTRLYGYLLDQKLVDYRSYGEYDIYETEDKIDTQTTNVGIAFFTTSYARTELYKLLKAIKDAGGNIYYCDTDSAITDYPIYEDKNFKKFIGSGGKKLGEITNETDEEGGYYKEIITLGNKMYCLRNEQLKKPKNRKIIKMQGLNSKQKFMKKSIDHEKKIIEYKEANRIEGKEKIDFEDYKLLDKGYTLVCDNMNFITGMREMVMKDKGMIKLNNTKRIKKLYDKADVDEEGNITPMVI
jgi:hypothetical protein